MKRGPFTIILVTLLSCISAKAQLPAGFTQTRLAENLDPTSLCIAPDGRVFITIKSGTIRVIENGVLLPGAFLSLAVDNFNERGLGHMVLDPQFESNHYYYVYYTVPGQNRNRISRFTANGNSTLPNSEVVLLDLNPLESTIHNAGAMVFLPDGTLLVAIGDGGNAARSQQMTTLHGKVIRITTDPSAALRIPLDNPFVNDPSVVGINRAIYALGFRNPYSMDINPVTGQVLLGDVGGSQWEEVNDVLPGRNYGWPLIEGRRTTQSPPAQYQDPLYTYPHTEGRCAVIGAAFYQPPVTQFPPAYLGRFFFADYCQSAILMLNPANGQLIGTFATQTNRPVAMRTAPDGSFYYLSRAGLGGGSEGDNTSSNNGSLWRVAYTGSGAPFISVPPASLLVSAGESATFQLWAGGQAPLSYQWQIDGADIPGATGSTYTRPNVVLGDHLRKFRCRVSNAQGAVTSTEATLSVTANTRPQPVINLPTAGATYRAGDVLVFAGEATDAESGNLPAAQLTWRIDFHHDDHTHPGLAPVAGAGGTYMIPRVGETSDNVWYRVYLTASDGELTQTVSRDVFPQKSEFTVITTPPGLQVLVDAQPVTTPATITSVVGVTRTVGAPASQTVNGTVYLFEQWSAGQPRIFTFDTHPDNQTYTASFTPVPTGEGNGLLGLYFNTPTASFKPQPDFVRLDPQINFQWGGGGPGNGIGNDNFAVRWVGDITPPLTGTYTFTTVSDDGVRLWVNNELIIDRWILQAPTEWSGAIALTGGVRYPIKVEYFEAGGGAVMQLFWSSTLLPRQLIPTSQLQAPLTTAVEESNLFRVYPTLADAELTVVTTHDWVVINLLGQVMATQQTSREAETIDIRHWPPGLYVVKSKSGAVVKVLKK